MVQKAGEMAVAPMKGIIKQVLSGDSVIIWRKPQGGPPPERQLNFSNVTAPKPGRRPTATSTERIEDEPYAWESREFLRKLVVGKEVLFVVDASAGSRPGGGPREYGTLYLGKDIETGENVTKIMVSEGLLSLREGLQSREGDIAELFMMEALAKQAGKGKWAEDGKKHIRNVKWSVENPKTFIDKQNGRPIDAVVEHIRDGSTVRVLLLPDYIHITLMISGIRCPMFKLDSDLKPDKENAEKYASEAKYFVESRLLQKDVQVILETVNNNNFVGSILHPNGNIAEHLLKEGFAKCVDWSIATVSGGPEKLRAAERFSKEKKLRLWADYKPSAHQISEKEREFTGKVQEIVNGDGLIVRLNDGTLKRIFFSSIRAPRLQDTSRSTVKNFRPLYDIPWLFDAREFLRKKLIDQKVRVTVDYIQPPQNNFPEKICCTVRIDDINVAEAMVAKGLATVVRYRPDDDQRSSFFDDLLSAEARAEKKKEGVHGKEGHSIKVADITSDSVRAKNMQPFLKRAGRTEAVVEFVASGSRMRLYIEKSSCLITFILAGISCPRPTRPAPGGGGNLPGEEYGAEALNFTKNLVMQRNVEVEIDSMDKGGNFIGWLHFQGHNLSVSLVEEGLAKIHVTAESSPFYSALMSAEAEAKKKQINVWQDHVDKVEDPEKLEDLIVERKINYHPAVISCLTSEERFYCQFIADRKAIEELSENLQKEFAAKPPLAGAYTPKKGELCAALFTGDNQWYRARVERMSSEGQVSLFFVDYGNRECTKRVRCASLPLGFSGLPAYSHEMSLAFVKFPKDDDDCRQYAFELLQSELLDKELMVNIEYRNLGVEYVSIQVPGTKQDPVESLLSQGLALLDVRKSRQHHDLVVKYEAAQQAAKKKHLNIWQYGDITEDDAPEF